MGGRKWTPAELETLDREFASAPISELARRLDGRTTATIAKMAQKRGLRKSAEFISAQRRDIVNTVKSLAKFRETHGRSINDRTYKVWIGIRNRCTRATTTTYANYGGRGITVCDRWLDSFENFLADMGERPQGMSIGRIDNDGNYEPSNCRWETNSEQARNKRTSRYVTAFGQTKVMAEWCELYRIDNDTLRYRLGRMSPEIALTRPVARRGRGASTTGVA